MKQKKLLGLIILTLILALALPVLAQPRGLGRGGGPGAMGPRFYNPQTVTTVKGQVESLSTYPMMGARAGRRGLMCQGLVLKTDKGNITVHLGPPGYVSQQGLTVKKGDTLVVTGSKVTQNQHPVLLAAEIKKNSQTLKLRDEQGFPLWRGPGRRGVGRGGQGRGWR